MARRRNIDAVGHAHELTFSCYRNFPFLSAQRTAQWMADSLKQVRRTLKVQLWAYVFMPDHVHLIICPTLATYSISQIRKSIKAPVARHAIQYLKVNSPDWLPRISRFRGSKTEQLFWQSGGGYDRNIVDSKTLLAMIDYIHLNPVRKGLASTPGEWKWSSANTLINGVEGPIRLDAIPAEWLG